MRGSFAVGENICKNNDLLFQGYWKPAVSCGFNCVCLNKINEMQHVKNENTLLAKDVSHAGYFCSSILCHGDF